MLAHVAYLMFHEIYQNVPLHISPIAFMIGSFAVRWYAFSYIVGFMVVYFLLMWRIKYEDSGLIARIFYGRGKSDILNLKFQIPDLLMDFLLLSFFSSLIGGRLGYVIFYNLHYFLQNPLAIIWPFERKNFVGFFGMSFHGAVIAVIISSLIFARLKKINFWGWSDFIVPAIPLGYVFGRLGNFLNGELYGRITDSYLGMYFIGDAAHLRYPSQIIEALLEGILLFIVLWTVRNKKQFARSFFAFYLIGYSILRVVAETFREPDPQIGFLLYHFTLGQILSVVMLLLGLVILFFQTRKKVLYL